MQKNVQMTFRQDVYDDIMALADEMNCPPEAAVSYAVRMIYACIQEGLLTNIRESSHQERKFTGTMGKVLAFPDKKIE